MEINERNLKLLNGFIDRLQSEVREDADRRTPQDGYFWQTRTEAVEDRVDEAVEVILQDLATDLARKHLSTTDSEPQE